MMFDRRYILSKYSSTFRKECKKLIHDMISNFKQLQDDPNDVYALKKIVQCADTIMCNAKFLGDKTLVNESKAIIQIYGTFGTKPIDINDLASRLYKIDTHLSRFL